MCLPASTRGISTAVERPGEWRQDDSDGVLGAPADSLFLTAVLADVGEGLQSAEENSIVNKICNRLRLVCAVPH